MTDFYVSVLSGDDANDGLTLVTAKKTINGVLSPVSDEFDTIFIYPGIYKEEIDQQQAQIFEAVGKVILDAEFKRKWIWKGENGTRKWTMKGFEFRNCHGGAIQYGGNVGNDDISNPSPSDDIVENCIFRDCSSVIRPVDTDMYFRFEDNLVYNCNFIGMVVLSSSGTTIFRNNTFHNCEKGLFSKENHPNSLIIEDNIFSNIRDFATRHDTTVVLSSIDGNIYNLSLGTSYGIINITDYTTLLDWQSVTGDEAGSQDTDPLFANSDGGVFSILPGSPAESGSLTGGYVGARFTEYGWYNDAIVSSGVTLVNTQFRNPGYGSGISLVDGQASGTIELTPLDMGQIRNISGILDRFVENSNDGFIDTNPLDNALPSGELTIEFRIADTLVALSGASYEELNLRDQLPSNSGRYIQSRLTLNRA